MQKNTGFFLILLLCIGMILVTGCTSSGSTPATVATPVLTPIATPVATAVAVNTITATQVQTAANVVTIVTTAVTSTLKENPNSNALSLNTPYQFDVPNSPNQISIKITRASLWDYFTLQNQGSSSTTKITPNEGKRFLAIGIDAKYMGNDGAYPPSSGSYTLIIDNTKYTPKSLSGTIQGTGPIYKTAAITSGEPGGGFLIYEVPSTTSLEQAYINLAINYGDNGSPVWKLI